MAEVEAIIAALKSLVPGAFLGAFPAGHPVIRREAEADPALSQQLKVLKLDVPRSRLAGTFIVMEDPAAALPEPDVLLQSNFRGDGLDALAWYKTFHAWPEKRWGIKIFEKGVLFLARFLEDHGTGKPSGQSVPDTLDYVQASFNVLQLHEHFHFLTDIACTLVELSSHSALACKYLLNVYGQGNRFEEAIANAYTWRKMRKQPLNKEIRHFMQAQPSPYDEFATWTERRPFQAGRQKLAGLFSPGPNCESSPVAGLELLFRIDDADLDFQDVPIYLEMYKSAGRQPPALRFVERIEPTEKADSFKIEYHLLDEPVRKKVDATVTKLGKNVQAPALGFSKIPGKGPVFLCRVDSSHGLSLRHLGGEAWQLLHVGRYRDVRAAGF